MDNALVKGFRDWLSARVSENTVRDYTNVVYRDTWPPRKKSHIRAWRNYVKYLFSIGRLTWEEQQHYLAFLKMPKQKTSIKRAVDESIIIKYIDIMRENGYETIAILLLGGSRLSHIIYMLNNYEPGEIVKHPSGEYDTRIMCLMPKADFCRYYLGVRFGSKRCDYIYFPVCNIEKQDISYRKLRDKLRRLGVQAKLFRKYVNQKLEELAMQHNIRLDAVNLIMSRELSITGAHYLNTRDLADRLFSIYVGYLRKKVITCL